MSGWVYLLGNESMPGLFKIGMTTVHDPWERARQLSKGSATPTPFDVLVAARCNDPEARERELHAEYKACRVSAGREFFRLGDRLPGAVGAVCRCGGPHAFQVHDYIFGVRAGRHLHPSVVPGAMRTIRRPERV